jgi:hypothetical protein
MKYNVHRISKIGLCYHLLKVKSFTLHQSDYIKIHFKIDFRTF